MKENNNSLRSSIFLLLIGSILLTLAKFSLLSVINNGLIFLSIFSLVGAFFEIIALLKIKDLLNEFNKAFKMILLDIFLEMLAFILSMIGGAVTNIANIMVLCSSIISLISFIVNIFIVYFIILGIRKYLKKEENFGRNIFFIYASGYSITSILTIVTIFDINANISTILTIIMVAITAVVNIFYIYFLIKNHVDLKKY